MTIRIKQGFPVLPEGVIVPRGWKARYRKIRRDYVRGYISQGEYAEKLAKLNKEAFYERRGDQ